MIDFAINDIGDIKLEEPKQVYPKYKIKFLISSAYPKMKINFRTRTGRKKRAGGLKINFVSDISLREYNKNIAIVRDTEEQSQSIAIRLKTELGELQDFFGDFGSELNKIRHTDINLTNDKKNTIINYVENAIYDIFKSSDITVNVEKLDTEPGNFKLETLKITVATKDGKTLYSCTI